MPPRGPAPESALPTTGHRIAPALAAKIRGKVNLDSGVLDNGLLDNGIRPTGTISQHDAAMTVPQKARAISKDPTGRKAIVALGPMPKTAHPGDAVARLAKLADQADATADGVHNIPNCYSRGGSHVPTLHF